MPTKKEDTTLQVYDAANLPASTRGSGAFQEIRNMIRGVVSGVLKHVQQIHYHPPLIQLNKPFP